MEKMYLVKYSGGSYDDWFSEDIFITSKKYKATKYVNKFNRILKKWKEYYSQFEDDKYRFPWIKDEFVDKHFDRWNSLRKINKCYFEEIEVR